METFLCDPTYLHSSSFPICGSAGLAPASPAHSIQDVFGRSPLIRTPAPYTARA
jgi:hypothetical protein